MQKLVVIFILLVGKCPFCVNHIQKFKSQFKRKFGANTNMSVQNFLVMLNFSILDLFCKFCGKLLKILNQKDTV